MPTKTCTRCAGKGTILAYRATHAGVCFVCKGSGVVRSRPTPQRKTAQAMPLLPAVHLDDPEF